MPSQAYDGMFLDYTLHLRINSQNFSFISFFAPKIPLFKHNRAPTRLPTRYCTVFYNKTDLPLTLLF